MEDLLKHLDYCADTGQLTWNKRVNARAAEGQRAGSVRRDGYVVIGWKGKYYYAHRLTWHIHYGKWPEQVDHVNGHRNDNRITNLRECKEGSNNQNTSRLRNNTSGFTGVRFEPRRKHWIATCYSNGKHVYLGSFSSAEEARAVYVSYKADNHPMYNGRD